MLTGFWWGNLKERNFMENLGLEGKDNIEWSIKQIEWKEMDRNIITQDMESGGGGIVEKGMLFFPIN